MSDFSERLTAARKAAHLKQREVAAALGVATSSYTAYETGAREPNLQKIRTISAFIGVSADELLGIEKTERTTIQQIYDDLSPKGQGQLIDFGRFLNGKEHDSNPAVS